MNIVYIFPQCIYNKYYDYDFRKSLLLLANHYHYFHYLNVQRCCQFDKTVVKKKERQRKENTTTKKYEKKPMFTKILSREEANEEIEIDSD